MKTNYDRIRAAGLFLKGGLFHAVLDLPLAGGTIEIVLHGISTFEDAAKALMVFCGGDSAMPVAV